jgi:hypothetical protein
VVAILFATTRITCRGLNVTVRDRTDPHVAICRRNRECCDAPELALIFDGLTVRIEIGEVPASQLARYSGPGIVDVAKPGVPGGFEIEWMLDTRCLPGLTVE